MGTSARAFTPMTLADAWLAAIAPRAERAALAFEQLWQRPLSADAGAQVDLCAPLAPDWGTGVYFELEGDAVGCIALLLRETGVARAASAGAGASEAPRPLLIELANIVASQVVSGLADALAGRILPSIPRLASGPPERELARRRERLRLGAHAVRIELGFRAEGCEPELLLVLIAELPAQRAL